VVATRRSDTLITTEARQARADELIAALPARAWRRISAGAGAHGPREYDWARLPIRIGWARGRGHWLMARRSISDPAEIAYYVCYGPRRSSLAGPGLDRRDTLADRRMLPAGQERSRPGPLPSPQLAGLVPPHHTVDARPRLARGLPVPGNKGGNRSRRIRHDRLHATGDPPVVDQAGPPRRSHCRTRLVLVDLAPPTPTPSPPQPLQTTRLPPHPSAVAVLSHR
jgi:hypothetical protein